MCYTELAVRQSGGVTTGIIVDMWLRHCSLRSYELGDGTWGVNNNTYVITLNAAASTDRCDGKRCTWGFGSAISTVACQLCSRGHRLQGKLQSNSDKGWSR